MKRRPFVLAQTAERSVIQGVNSNARKEGIREGMALCRARRLCRRIHVIPSDVCHYREKHLEIVREFGFFSPLVEGSCPGSYFIDVTGTHRLWGPGPDLACRMEKDLSIKMGLRARIGLASNKLVSQVAANCIGPGDLSFIFPGNEESFLSPLPVDFLPGAGEVTTSRLAGFNIVIIGQLASFPLDMLAAVFGRNADVSLKSQREWILPPYCPLGRSRGYPLQRSWTVMKSIRDGSNRLCSSRLKRVDGTCAVKIAVREASGWRFGMRTGSRLMPGSGFFPASVQSDRLLFRSVLPVFYKLFRRRVAVRRLVLEFSDLVMPFVSASAFHVGKQKIVKRATTFRRSWIRSGSNSGKR